MTITFEHESDGSPFTAFNTSTHGPNLTFHNATNNFRLSLHATRLGFLKLRLRIRTGINETYSEPFSVEVKCQGLRDKSNRCALLPSYFYDVDQVTCPQTIFEDIFECFGIQSNLTLCPVTIELKPSEKKNISPLKIREDHRLELVWCKSSNFTY